MELEEGRVRVDEGMGGCVKRIFLFGVLLIGGLVIGLALWFTILRGSPFPGCLGGSQGFNRTRYTLPDGSFSEISYLFVEKEEGRQFYSFEEGKDRCEQEGAQTWEVLGGVSEWNLLYGIAKKKEFIGPEGSGIWLNAVLNDEVTHCPPGSPSTSNCREEKAQNGEGLPVYWPSTGQRSSYSRLAGREEDAEDEEEDEKKKECVIVNYKGLWEIQDCSYGFWTLCVKRTC